MSRIVVDYRLAGAGGLGRFIESITPYLYQYSEYYLILNKNQKIPDLPFKYQKIYFNSGILTVGEQFEFIFKVPRSDILFIPFFNIPLAFPFCRSKNLVSMVHDLYHLDMASDKSIFNRLLYSVYLFFSIHFSAHIFTVSYFSLRRLLLHYPDTPPVSLLYNAINKSLSSCFDGTNISTKLKTFYVRGSKPLLFVGNLKIHKNLFELLKALQLDNSLRLVVVGSSVGRSSIQNVLKNMSVDLSLSDRIFFAGRVNDEELSYCYKSSLALVFPSLYEGFGIPLIEAQSHDLPVLCSNISPFKEIAGDSVLYFSPNSMSILTCIRKFLAMNPNDVKSLVKLGRINSLRFSWPNSAFHASQIFQLLSKPSSTSREENASASFVS